MRAAPLGLRLFLEGIEVPVISAQVSFTPSQPAAASIQIVPTDAALEFMPRTLIHLFYLDDAYFKNPDVVPEVAPSSGKQTINRLDAPDWAYKLLYVGELTGVSIQKTPQSRAVVLQSMDLSIHWDTCYQWFADWSVYGSALTDKRHTFTGSGSGLFDNIASGTRWVISNILFTKPKSPHYHNAKGLLGGMISLIETIGGLRGGRGSGAGLRGVNDYFTVADRRYNFLGMLGAIEADNTSIRMFKGKAFRNWLQSGMSSAGSLISFRDTLRLVGQYIYHDVYPNPAAHYRTGEGQKSTYYTRTVTNKELDSEIKSAMKEIKKVIHAIQAANTELLFNGDSNPDYTSPKKVEDWAISAREHIKKAIQKNGGTIPSYNLESAFTKIKSTLVVLHTSVLAKGYGSGVDQQFRNAQDAYDLLAGAVSSGPYTKSHKHTQTDDGEYLFNQLILPECFWASPPRCNVIFPDQYTEFSYSRNYMREVSRISLQGGMGVLGGGHSAVLSRYYYAPTVKDVNGESLHTAMSKGGRILLPHEVHSGIIPKFEWVTAGQRWAVKAAKSKGLQRVSYIQKLANYQFLFNRWAARNMSVTGRFNPNLVLGMSALVLDRGSNSKEENARKTEILGYARPPTQYLGKIVSVSHSINQGGGTTSVAMSHARTHRGADDEFLGMLQADTATMAAFVGSDSTTIQITKMGKMLEPGRKDAALTKEEKVQLLILKELQKYLYAEGKAIPDSFNEPTTSAPLINGGDLGYREWPTIKGGNSIVGTSIPGVGRIASVKVEGVELLKDSKRKQIGLDFTISTMRVPDSWLNQNNMLWAKEGKDGAPWFVPKKITVTYDSARIVEKGGSTGIPIEDAMMPGWFQKEVWGSKSIGDKVYTPLLGCKAITNDMDFDGKPVNGVLTAVDNLTEQYGAIKNNHGDVHGFINRYTKRPIASLPEVIGGYTEDGTYIEGFHKWAFGDYNVDVDFSAGKGVAGSKAMEGLFDDGPPVEYRGGGKVPKGTDPNIPAYLDPRGSARARVRIYMAELNFSRGLKG